MTRGFSCVLAFAILLTTFAAVVAIPRAAGATPDMGWQPPQPVQVGTPQSAFLGGVSLSAGGTGVVVYQRTGAHDFIWATRFAPGAGAGGTNWAVPVRLSQGPWGAYQPSTATDGAGGIIVLWTEWLLTKGYAIHASRYQVGVGWTPPQQIDQPSGFSYEPQIAMNGAGTAFATWVVWDGTRWNIWANRFVPGVGWGSAVALDTTTFSAAKARVGVDGAGNAIVTWYEYDGTRNNIMAARYSGGWGAPVALEASAQDAAYPGIGMDGGGNAIVSWVQWDGSRYNVWANRYVAGPGWTGALLIEASANTALGYTAPAVAMNTGNGIVAWGMWDGTYYSIYANRYVSGTGWMGEAPVDGLPDNCLYPSVGMDGSGNDFIVFTRYISGPPSQQQNWGLRYDAVGAFWSISSLDYSRDSIGNPLIAVDGAGNALAVWNYDENPATDIDTAGILANRYTFGTGWYNYWQTQPAEFDQQLNSGGNVLHANDAGQAVLTWIQDDGPVYDAYASLYYPGVGWTAPALLENLDYGDVTEMDSAIDASGNVIAIYQIWDGTKYSLYSTHYSVSTGWGSPVRVDNLPADPYWLRVAMDPAGDGMAVWQQYDGAAYSIFASRFDGATLAWNTPTRVEADPNDAYGSHVAMDGAGDAMAVWSQWDGARYNNFANWYQAGVGWGMPVLIERNSLTAGWPAVAMNQAGEAVVSWSWWTGTNYDAAAVAYSPAGGWEPEVTLENSPGDGYVATPAMDERGNGFVAWQVWGNGEWDLWAIRHAAVGGWQQPAPLEGTSGDAADVYVAADYRGNAYAAWRQFNGQSWDIVARRYIVDNGWLPPVVVDSRAEIAYEPKVAVDGHGNGLVAWRQLNLGVLVPWTAEYIVGDGRPNLMVTAPANGLLTSNPTVAVSGMTDPGARVWIDGALISAAVDGSFNRPITLPDGPHTFTVIAQNAAGMTTTEIRTATVDTRPPSLTITSPAPGLTNVPVAWVSGVTEPGATVDVDGIQATVDATGRFGLTEGMAEGGNTFVVIATDAAGNSRTASVTVTLDTIAPALDLAMPVAQVTNNPNLLVSGTTEVGALLTVDGNAVFVGPTGAFSTTITLPEGTHTFTVVAKDAAGNSATRTAVATVDLTAPALTITTPATTTVLTRDPLLSIFGATEPGARLVVNGIAGDVSPAGNFVFRLLLREGLTGVTVTATDPAGNVASILLGVTVDTTPPQLSLFSPADGTLTNDPAVFVSGLTDPGTTVTVDGTPVTVSPSGGFSTIVYIVGVHVFDVVARDPAGNVARAAAVVEFDNTAPAVAITAPATGTRVSVPTVTIAGQSEPGAHVVVNGYSVFVDTTGAFSVRLALQVGANAITATATDDAGNTATDSITVTYVDPVPGLRQQLNDTNDELNNTKDALTQTRNTLATTNANLNATRGDLAVANANLASLGTEALILLVLVIVSIVLGAVQFLMLRRMQGRQRAPPPPT